MKYAVYDDDRPAKFPECKVHPSWKNNVFDTLDEAAEYTHKWLDMYSPGIETLKEVALNKSWDYSGYGSFIEITEEKDE